MKAKLLTLLVCLAAAEAVWLGFKAGRVKKIDCRLDQYPCPLNLEPVLLGFIGRNIFTLPSESVERQLVSFDPTLTEIVVNKHLPDRLEIDLTRRLPVAKIVMAAKLTLEASLSATLKDESYYLDKGGYVYLPAVLVSQPLPEVWWPETSPLVEGKSDLSQNLAQLIDTLAAYYVVFDRIARLPEDYYLVKERSGIEALVPAGGDFAAPVATLQFILSNIKIGEVKPAIIDLRFDKPILRF